MDTLPLANIEVEEIHSDLEEENTPSTFVCSDNGFTTMTSSSTTTQLFGNTFYSLFPQHSFSQINLSHILSATNGTDLISSAPIPISIPFPTLTTLLVPF